MTFSHPLLLLTLLVVPLALGLYKLAARRRMRYAVRYTNVDVLALVVAASSRPWRRYLATSLFLASIAALCVAVSRPHVTSTVTSDRATVILVLDVSGSMQAVDVKPTRLAAAQKAIHTFLDKVPSRVRVGLVLFAGEAQVATPPTRDHELVGEAVDAAGEFRGFGGTAIGEALATAVRLGLQITGSSGRGSLASYTTAPPQVSSTLVSILFLSDGRQTEGLLQPLQGAARARAAGFPVYTVALGTTGQTTLRGFPGGFPGGGGGGFGGIGRRGLSPDPVTLKAIATQTGGTFFRARSAGAVDAAYSKLGSSLGRTSGPVEVTDIFLAIGAALLVLGGALSAFWSPRLP
ncbi:MAG TPA: VWA domain-containing protein [Gaiellaceae bacterium]